MIVTEIIFQNWGGGGVLEGRLGFGSPSPIFVDGGVGGGGRGVKKLSSSVKTASAALSPPADYFPIVFVQMFGWKIQSREPGRPNWRRQRAWTN